ncbi:MAG TPA: chemotaxis protein CheW [Gemmatimonadaceae bacterium]|nr:chemotaxis protein CheW [Gemmatimonadaceae bacterium]
MTSSTSIETTPNAAIQNLLIIEVRGHLFALDASYLREVIPARTATRIPGAPALVKGLINLRGSLIVVADVALRLLGSDAGPSPDDGSIVLVEVDGKNIGLAVQDVRDVVALEVEPIDGSTKVALGQGSSSSPTATAGSLCLGVGRLESEIVIVLDVAALARQVVA